MAHKTVNRDTRTDKGVYVVARDRKRLYAVGSGTNHAHGRGKRQDRSETTGKEKQTAHVDSESGRGD